MKTIPILAVFLFLSTANFAQEHAPTPDQCQADERMWSNESVHATSGTGFDLTIKQYPLNEMIARSKEMLGCVAVDRRNAGTYNSTAALILSQIERRLIRYIQETDQADKYDAWEKQQAGK